MAVWAKQPLPIALIVDDSCPCINPLWYFRRQVGGIAEPPYPRTIPVDFCQRFAEWAAESGVKGDFTVLPCPAGLGPLTEGLRGFPPAEVERWLSIVREWIMPRFDLHPEILTHTLALDLETKQLLPEAEHEWMSRQSQEGLTEYIAEAMRILREVGLPSNGITQPCSFSGDECAYARAIGAAERKVNGRNISHYFLHVAAQGSPPVPAVTWMDRGKGAAVVSIVSGTPDAFWRSMDEECAAEELADVLLTADGRGGRLRELFEAGVPLVFHTHWQSLYSNGSEVGLRGLQETVRRIARHWGSQVRWARISEIAGEVATQALQTEPGEIQRP
ncbi:MAG TPA: hypothetical protein EYP85_06695 [Armatimonadetes bacterium]|nr:hypothetical protein [Armatimonadota bacterium]